MVAQQPGWRAVDPLLHFPNERNSLRIRNVSTDQRTSFRITEDVLLACIVLSDDADLSKPIQSLFEPCEAYEMETRLEELDQGYRECHARLARIDPTAAEAADWLSAKLDVLKETLLAQRRASGNGMRRTSVSLAVSGIGFRYAMQLPVGQILAVHLVMEGSHESFMAYARVRQCRADDDALWIGAEFEPLSPDTQRRLSKHILQAQIKQRKQ
jgi:hypothetical protein